MNIKKYDKALSDALAGGMGNDEAHEFALDQATREIKTEADPVKAGATPGQTGNASRLIMSTLEPYKVEVFKITYHRLLTAKESLLGGWLYSKPLLGEIVVMADGIEDAEAQALKQFPKGNAVQGACWELNRWQTCWSSNCPSR